MVEQPIRLYRTGSGCVIEHNGEFHEAVNCAWDELITQDDLEDRLREMIRRHSGPVHGQLDESMIRAPIGAQEVWAAGVTYYRSRDARMEESKSAGGGDFYDRVYNAERPELFFKSTASRVVGHRGQVAIRRDASWSVPEPEVTLLISPTGKILGYTIGNDMSSRDIEGENLLYLPQAKVYDRSCALGPWITLGATEADVRGWTIALAIHRGGQPVFTGQTSAGQLKRSFAELTAYLGRSQSFPHGAVLLTGTGVVPPDAFTLQAGDIVEIVISGIGTLRNTVAVV